MTAWVWLAAGLILLACEVLTPGGFYLLFLGISGMLVGMAMFGFPEMAVWLQFTLFAVLSAVSVGFFRKPLLTRFQKPPGAPEVDSIVGETAIALDEIAVSGVGKAELRGTAWSARNVGARPVARAERCIVEKIDGLMLHIRNQ
jgi:membrane protein implicated in regulation of membrane protease activity